MANFALKDTGFTDVGRSKGNFTTFTLATADEFKKGHYKANDGDELGFKSTRLDYGRGTNIDDSSVPNNLVGSEIGVGSSENGKITIKGVLDPSDSTDINTILQLDRMCRTKGIKLLYYTSTTDDFSDSNIVYALGQGVNSDKVAIKNDNHVNGNDLPGTDYPHVHVIVNSVTYSQLTPNSKVLSFNIDLEVTN